MASPDIPYSVSASDIELLKNELNAILSSVADRLDKIEGLRGDPEMGSFLTMKNSRIVILDSDDNIIHQFGDAT